MSSTMITAAVSLHGRGALSTAVAVAKGQLVLPFPERTIVQMRPKPSPVGRKQVILDQQHGFAPVAPSDPPLYTAMYADYTNTMASTTQDEYGVNRLNQQVIDNQQQGDEQ
jgi:hypothetical protein